MDPKSGEGGGAFYINRKKWVGGQAPPPLPFASVCIGYTPRARLLSDLATSCLRHSVAKSLGNQA